VFYLKIIELSYLLSDGMAVFPNDPSFSLNETTSHEKDGFSLSILKSGLHTGTHLDSPYHFHPSGRKVKDVDLDELIGPAQIIDVNKQVITKSYLKNVNPDKILIIRTGWESHWEKTDYFMDNPYLTSEAAELLVKKGIKGLGIDSPNVDTFGNTAIHEILLSHDMWIVENLKNLDQIGSNHFEIFLIPLRIDAEGSMVRAFARI
jgi:arylformamidase